VYGTLLGGLLFGDKLTVVGCLGQLLILAGVLLVTLRSPSAPAAVCGKAVGSAAAFRRRMI
jgi:drug/metabolite transporter (DMT)-like permease